ncbi:DUF669 domain-containing protein [Candidatus Williamhamiltonella defendens]|nr:DUF669 domain-containing protein [Candidatus Hamiltonella defensa]AYB49571.1 DUF669 domain-containing protein [Candidatus Hamiltonella defensa]
MTLNPFIYNPQQALAAGQSGFITDSGSYVVTITDARFSVQPSGAKSMELSIETEEGRKAQYLHLYHEKKDGTANPYGLQLIHALMGCMGVRQLHPPTHPGGPVSEFIGKKVGLMLQKTLKTRADGKETYRLDIILPFFAQTRQTLREKLDGQPARDVDHRLASLKDKDERVFKKREEMNVHPSAFDDAIPF